MAAEVISRKDARAQGLKRYFTGQPCPSGHISHRHVSTAGCVECARIKSNARNLPGGSRQPKGKSASFVANAAARAAARKNGLTRYFTAEACPRGHVAERYVSSGQCADCLVAWKRAWRSANRETLNGKARELRAANPEKARACTRKWQSTTHGRSVKLRIENKRRARKLGCSEHYTPEDVQRILAAQRFCCAYCRNTIRTSFEVDHIIPLARGGSDDKRNIQMVCAICNRRKQAKDPIKHARDLGMLI